MQLGMLGKCLRNKGASKGVTVFDGCQAFMPKPRNPQKCEACGCHASFHLRLDGLTAGTVVPPVGIQYDEVPIIPRRGQDVAAGGSQEKAGKGGGNRYKRKRGLTIAETAAELGLSVEPNYPGEEKHSGVEPTIAQLAAQRGLKLDLNRAERVARFGPGGAPTAAVHRRTSEWASVVDLTEADGSAGGSGRGKRRNREEPGGSAKKSHVVSGAQSAAWGSTAFETLGGSAMGRAGTGASQSGGAGEAASPGDARQAPGQGAVESGGAKRRGRPPKVLKAKAMAAEKWGPEKGGATGGSSRYTAFGDGIGSAQKMLADFLSGRTWLEKDLTFKEVYMKDKHLLILRSQLGRTVTDPLDAQPTTKKIVAYLALNDKERVEQTQPVGTIRVVLQPPFGCGRRPGVAEWLESRSLSTHVAELSHLYTFPQYRNGAVSIPLFAHVCMKILKPAGVNCVLFSMERTQVERYLMKHLNFLGCKFIDIEKSVEGQCVLALDLDKVVVLRIGPSNAV